MSSHVLGFLESGATQVALAGGKGAHLAALARLDGVHVPAGFCITTDAFRRVVEDAPAIHDWCDRLARLQADDRPTIRTLTAEIRRLIESATIPRDLAAAITRKVVVLGDRAAYAVRSSATAEDLPATSFAGQHETYLNIVGFEEILRHVRRCWASLFTERAVSYRMRNGVDHRAVRMAVVVQRMVAPQVAGILFTADPVTGHRKITSIEAGFGPGEDLVSGRVKGDIYQVRDGEIVVRTPADSRRGALADADVARLAQLGRRIEAHLGSPQDVEWCLADGDIHVVQSRPITTLFPIPAAGDGENRVYISVGHQQMMTDAMKPLGLSFWQLTTPAPMAEAGGRLFVDVTRRLASSAGRAAFLTMLRRSDPLVEDALERLLCRGDFIRSLPDEGVDAPVPPSTPPPPETDPTIVRELMTRTETSLAILKHEIRARSGAALLDFILEDLQELKRLLFDPRSHQVVMAGMEATWWLNEQLLAWLGETNAADALAQSAPHNITSEMGLALLDVADAIRPHPEVVAFLERVGHERFLENLPGLSGGPAARAAIEGWLEKYGMRGAGEIDITRPRWSERPSALVPLILAHVRTFVPGESGRRLGAGRREARKKEEELLERLRGLPDGERKAGDTKRMIDRVRAFTGYREYPKYGMISRYFVYKEALMAEAERLVQRNVLRDQEDMFFLRFDELQEAVRTGHVQDGLIRRRRIEFESYRSLTPPRVLTSDGEAVRGSLRRGDLPCGALVGLPVSAGTVEGRARILLDISGAELDSGDILVTTSTDPGWTPLFVSAAGLVTEVGGLMTHGAVIAREYGLPAVVSVEGATRLIRDGQRIRVHGTEGYVEILP